MGESYAASGVDIEAGEEAVRRIKAAVRSTYRPEVLGDIGGFGGLFAVPTDRYKEPVLVAATDGVGTKVLVAELVGRDRILSGSTARAGDVLVGLPSPGLRSNGYSLARRVLFDVSGLSVDDPL